MKNYVEPMERLTNEFSKLPAVGKKTASRYAYHIINSDMEYVKAFCDAIMQAKQKVHYCEKCGNFTDKTVCDICSQDKLQPIICVVKEPKDVIAMERVRDYHGTYHVLHGVISPLQNVGPNDLNIKSLLSRISTEDTKEIIIATNPDVEGEATAIYLSNLLKPLGIKVSRLAQGIAMGSELEYADEVTLAHAFENRKQI